MSLRDHKIVNWLGVPDCNTLIFVRKQFVPSIDVVVIYYNLKLIAIRDDF